MADFDFNDVAHDEDPVWFPLEHPVSGELLTHGGALVKMGILGPDTKKMQTVEGKISDRRLAGMARTGKPNLNAQALEKENIERAVASIVGWENFYIGGQAVAFDASETRKLLETYPWLERFWEEKYRNAGNFLGTEENTATS